MKQIIKFKYKLILTALRLIFRHIQNHIVIVLIVSLVIIEIIILDVIILINHNDRFYSSDCNFQILFH